MKARIEALILAVLLALSGCAGPAASPEDIREKLLLAYQYLEQMDYDNALDAFAAVIKIDEKQADAYIGMARAYSAKGEQEKAKEYAGKGAEATDSEELRNLEDMYSRIGSHEDRLKELADLLRKGGRDIPGELEAGESHLFSELLDGLWTDLDSESTWTIYDGSSYVFVYPTDPEKGEYMLLYPDGHFYLGQVEFTPYSSLAETEGSSREPIIVPFFHGQGIWAGVSENGNRADFYTGSWEEGLAQGEGIYVFQTIPEGGRYVFYGSFEGGKFGAYTALYGSDDDFLMHAIGEERDESALFEAFGEGPSGQDEDSLRIPASHTGGLFKVSFRNMELFRLLDQGNIDAVRAELLKRRNNALFPGQISGNLIYMGFCWEPKDMNADHTLYMISPNGKGTPSPYMGSFDLDSTAPEGRHYVINNYGTILRSFDKWTWFTETGFRSLIYMDTSTGEEYAKDFMTMYEDPNAEIWFIDYDAQGAETGRSRAGSMEDYFEIAESGVNPGITYAWAEDGEGEDPRIRVEETEAGFRITDINGNEVGTIVLEGSKEGAKWAVNGNILTIDRDFGQDDYMFCAAGL